MLGMTWVAYTVRMRRCMGQTEVVVAQSFALQKLCGSFAQGPGPCVIGRPSRDRASVPRNQKPQTLKSTKSDSITSSAP